jgi:hypothetical protein
MPRLSRKRVYVNKLCKWFSLRLLNRGYRSVIDEEDSIEDAIDLAVAMAIRNSDKRRFLFRRSKYRKGTDRFSADLEEEGNEEDNALRYKLVGLSIVSNSKL